MQRSAMAISRRQNALSPFHLSALLRLLCDQSYRACDLYFGYLYLKLNLRHA